jgi:hypothetical protein
VRFARVQTLRESLTPHTPWRTSLRPGWLRAPTRTSAIFADRPGKPGLSQRRADTVPRRTDDTTRDHVPRLTAALLVQATVARPELAEATLAIAAVRGLLEREYVRSPNLC